jgi:6-phosphogluconolactonase (cycloisomerase 2 family)
MSNSPAGNAVIVFDRDSDGSLAFSASYATGGTGTGASLANQEGVVLSDDHKRLFVVNAGSGSISAFSVQERKGGSPFRGVDPWHFNPTWSWQSLLNSKRSSGLELTDMAPSGGVDPISIAVHGSLLYVLNAGDDSHPGNVTGFTISKKGLLAPLPNSVRPLSAASTDPAQIAFAPSGDALVVTEKATNLIDVYTVNLDGLAQGPMSFPSAGATPYGFGFAPNGTLIVSEAAGSVSSYRITGEGQLQEITVSSGTHQQAPCWIAVTRNGRYAYATNAHSGSVTGFAVNGQGQLTALNADGVTASLGAERSPLDMALSENNRYLYVRTGDNNQIYSLRVNSDGSLTPFGGVSGLPAGFNGLAAY